MINKNLTPFNNKGQKHGYWELYWNENKLWYKGNYNNGKEIGHWEIYYDNGQLMYKLFYLI